MVKRSLEETVSTEDYTMQDSGIQDNYDDRGNDAKEISTANDSDDPMVRSLVVCMSLCYFVSPIV
jgi:hypothetical protein